MFKRLLAVRQTVSLAVVASLLAACNTTPATDKPPAWSVTETITNSSTPNVPSGAARQTVFFSRIPWQSMNPGAAHFASGWMNDVLVGNPYSFQLRVDGGNFLNGGLLVRDVASGQMLTVTQARVNHGENCGPNGHRAYGGTPQTADATRQCYYNPGEVPRDPSAIGFIPRPVLPENVATYSAELVPSCDRHLQYLDMRCSGASDTVTLLTLSPPSRPSAPVHGRKYDYELISRNNIGDSVTPISAIYVEPGRCRIDNFFIAPTSGNATDRVTAEWFVRDCHSITVKTDDPATPILYSNQVIAASQASEPSFNDSRPYLLPKRPTVTMTLEARDALGNRVTRTARVTVDPCSISKTSPQCPTRCQATPAPAGCPQPPQPACPVGEGDADRQLKNFTFEILCSTGGGTAFSREESELACTEAAARQSVTNRQVMGCGIVKFVGELAPNPTDPMPTPTCMGGAMPKDWEFCLACSSQTGPVLTTETKNACFLPDAVEAAKLNHPTQSCWLNNSNACP